MHRVFFNPLLLLLVALLFTAGYGHQIFWKYVSHHDGGAAAECAGGLHHDRDDGGSFPGGDGHPGHPCCGHHVVVAVLMEFTVAVASELMAVGVLDLISDATPEAIPPGIDYPPQLA